MTQPHSIDWKSHLWGSSVSEAAIAQRGGCAVGSVDVHPQVVRFRKRCDFRQGIDGAGVGGARIRDDGERAQSGGAILGDAAREFVERQPELRVRWNLANLLGKKSGDAPCPIDGRMRLIAVIDHRAGDPIIQFCVSRGHDGGEIRHGASADEKPARGVGKAAPLAQPVDHREFEGHGPGPGEPRSTENVEAARERIRHHADEVRGHRNEREMPRMADVHHVAEDVPPHGLENFIRRYGLGGRRLPH
jgi:hypothetical protein